MKWEYALVNLVKDQLVNLEKLLEDYGEAGWELVTLRDAEELYNQDYQYKIFQLIFKRPSEQVMLNRAVEYVVQSK